MFWAYVFSGDSSQRLCTAISIYKIIMNTGGKTTNNKSEHEFCQVETVVVIQFIYQVETRDSEFYQVETRDSEFWQT